MLRTEIEELNKEIQRNEGQDCKTVFHSVFADKTDDCHKAALKIHAHLKENNAWLVTSDYIIDELYN